MRFFVFILLVMTTSFNAIENQETNYVPDQKTAVSIAEAIWLPIYGEKVLEKQPFKATLSKDGKIWTVTGSIPPGTLGGFPIIEIRKSDCKIIRVSHSK